MKESMGVTYIFQFVILFILLFTAIMALTINNSNAFGIKDNVINIIEINNGNFKDGDMLSEEIVELLDSTSYRATGKCEDGYEGFNRAGESVTSDQQAALCIRRIDATSGVDTYLTGLLGENVATEDFKSGSYYQVVVFFQFSLPVVKQSYNISSKAETKVIYTKMR